MPVILRVLLPMFAISMPALAAEQPSNRQIMDAVVAAWGERGVDAMCAAVADDVDYYVMMPDSVPYSAHKKGNSREAFCSYLRAAAPEVEQISFEVFDTFESGNRVVYYGHESYRMKSLGKTSSQDFVWIWDLRDGRIVRFREFFDTEKLAHDLSD